MYTKKYKKVDNFTKTNYNFTKIFENQNNSNRYNDD